MADQKKAKNNKKSVFETIKAEDKDFFVTSLEKKIRNINKKLKEIENLEQQKLEKELKPEQIEKVNQKEALINKIKEIEEVGSIWKEALVEKKKEEKEKNQTDNNSTKATLVALFAAKASFDHLIDEVPEFTNLWNQTFHFGSATVAQRINNALLLLQNIQITDQTLSLIENVTFPVPEEKQHSEPIACSLTHASPQKQNEEQKVELQEHYSIQKKTRKQSHNSNSARKPSTRNEDIEPTHEQKVEVQQEKEEETKIEEKKSERPQDQKSRPYKGERNHNRNHYQKKKFQDREHKDHNEPREHRQYNKQQHHEEEDDDFQTVEHSHPQNKNSHPKHNHDHKEKRERKEERGQERKDKQARPNTGKPVVCYVAKQEQKK